MNPSTHPCSPPRPTLVTLRGLHLPSIVFLSWVCPQAAHAGPEGMSVVRGDVGAVRAGSLLSITASHNAVIQWQSFNLGAGDVTRFVQPDARSVVWNRIADVNPSQVWGSIQANGVVVLMNPNGFYFGSGASVEVGGLVATTARVAPPPEVGGGLWSFNGSPPTASIVNHGSIRVAEGGSLFLISEHVENHGDLIAPGGHVGLLAGASVLLSERPDGRGLSASVPLPEGAVDNLGRIMAPAGEISLRARIVNQGGLVQADSVRQHGGVIELVATESLRLSEGSVTRANGDTSGSSPGGRVTLRSSGTLQDVPGSRVEAQGGANGGDGGEIELSSARMDSIDGTITAAAAPGGGSAGRLLIDPYDILLSSGRGDTATGPGVRAEDPPDAVGDLLTIDVTRSFVGFSQIRLQASHDIRLDAGLAWDLAGSTGVSSPGSRLVLEAGNNILFGDSARLLAKSGWSVELIAGSDLVGPEPRARAGLGGIYLNGGPPDAGGRTPNLKGAIEAADGSIRLSAGHEVLVGGGFIRTVEGGDIVIRTGDGDVVSGTNPATYDYSNLGYTVSGLGLGGIGTAKGGSVTVDAGRDILSFAATIGTFGAPSADLRLTASRDVKGSFLVRNGVGRIEAGRDVGNASPAVTLGLVAGGWDVHGGRDVYVNEVYNPNGSLNESRLKGVGTVKFQFDYAPNAFARIRGGESVHLVGDGVLHAAGNPTRPPIYPPILDVDAGPGGVVLGNDLILAPSPVGSLRVRTTDGGGLASLPGRFAQLVVSDSGSPNYTTFATGHAQTPLHAAGLGEGLHLDISGDLRNVFLRAPMAADIRVGGDVVNFAFEGQNLSVRDVTSLVILGDYVSRSDRTFEVFSDEPDLQGLSDPVQSLRPELGSRFSFDPLTHRVGVQGILTAADLSFLRAPTRYVVDPVTQRPILGPDGYPLVEATRFTADLAALERLASRTRDIPTSGLAFAGLQVGGPGRFDIRARNLDLGISQGIRSVGLLKNPYLVGISPKGAEIGVQLSGDLAMTSSQIASFSGGGISVSAQGRMDVGSQDAFSSDDAPRGIYTGHGGSVDVRAVGDVSVNGSRIATYDGGDLRVVSERGSVDAGAGAKGFFAVTTSQVNAAGQVENRNDAFFGSGIMALTRSDGDAAVGNVLVSAAKDILANSGGVIQIAFNQRDQSGAMVKLDAGRDIVANQSGILGRNVGLSAGGDIRGLVVAAGNVNIQAQQNVSVTALAGGAASVSGGGSVAGTIAGGGNVSVSGAEVAASVVSTGGGASVSGDSSSASVGAFGTVAVAAAQKVVEAADKAVASAASSAVAAGEEEKKKLRPRPPVLLRRVGRVTVILPKQ